MAENGGKKRELKVIVQMAVMEEAGGPFTPDKDLIWAQEIIVLPIDRVAALDADAMLERLRQNVVVVAGLLDEP